MILLSQCLLTVRFFAVKFSAFFVSEKYLIFSVCNLIWNSPVLHSVLLKSHPPHMCLQLLLPLSIETFTWQIFFSQGCIMHVYMCMYTHKYICRYMFFKHVCQLWEISEKKLCSNFPVSNTWLLKFLHCLQKRALDLELEALFFLWDNIERKAKIPSGFPKSSSLLTVLFHFSRHLSSCFSTSNWSFVWHGTFTSYSPDD